MVLKNVSRLNMFICPFDWVKLSRKHAIDISQEDKHLSIFGGKTTDCINVGNEVAEIIENMGIELPFRDYKWYGEDDDTVRDEFYHQASNSIRVSFLIPHFLFPFTVITMMATFKLRVVNHRPNTLHSSSPNPFRFALSFDNFFCNSEGSIVVSMSAKPSRIFSFRRNTLFIIRCRHVPLFIFNNLPTYRAKN